MVVLDVQSWSQDSHLVYECMSVPWEIWVCLKDKAIVSIVKIEYFLI